MKQKIITYVSWIIVVVMFVQVMRICAKDQAKSFLCKVFYHESVQDSDSSVLLNGQLVLYFSWQKDEVIKPLLLEKNSIDAQHQTYSFFFPGVQILNEECKKMIERSVAKSTTDCAIEITETISPTPGIIIKIMCNTEKIAVQYAVFTAITGQQGVEFRFINQISLNAALKTINEKKTTKIALARPHIVIDPGHGGSDPGALGLHATVEKDICLSIAKMTHNMLVKRGYSSMLTRTDDVTVGLDERTLMANNFQADLYVSIHANSDASKKSFGVDVFFPKEPEFLDIFFTPLEMDEQKLLVSRRAVRQEESKRFAHIVKDTIIRKTQAHDRSIQQAVTQVLLGTQMPAVLIEVGFLSDAQEAKKLTTAVYQKKIAHAIDEAISKWLISNEKVFF